jgi:glycosyltransferase involved in cell wall biosynthesis
MPVFNAEKYLKKALDSIISQTFGHENIEVILVDDKSTDKSADIIRQYCERYDNFQGIYCDVGSGFPGKPRNIGLGKATSEYIMFLDSDDYLDDNACKALYETIKDEDADIVSGSFTKKDKNGAESINYNVWASTLTPPDMEKKDRLKMAEEMLADPDFKFVVTNLDENGGCILGNSSVWTKIYKRSLIEDNGIRFPEDIVAQDSVFLLESFYNAEKIVFIKDIIVHYNNIRNEDSDQSVSNIKSKNNLYGRIKAYDLMYDLSKRFGKEEIFYRNLLSLKLNYWYKSYLLKTPISALEIEEIFKKYSHLFSACYMTEVKMSKKPNKVFKEIHEGNYSKAAEMVCKKQNKPSKKTPEKPEPSYKKGLRRIIGKFKK